MTGLETNDYLPLAADVASATMTRLAQALGLDSFGAMSRPSMQAFVESVCARAGRYAGSGQPGTLHAPDRSGDAAGHTLGVPLLALTDSRLSPLARLAQQGSIFEATSPSFFHSMTGAQTLADALVECVAEQGDAAVLQQLSRR